MNRPTILLATRCFQVKADRPHALTSFLGFWLNFCGPATLSDGRVLVGDPDVGRLG